MTDGTWCGACTITTRNANALWYQLLNDTPGRVGPPIEKPPASIRQYFLDWLDRDGHPFWPFWENIASWWAIRDLPNLMLLHFEESDALTSPARCAASPPSSTSRSTKPACPAMVEHCSFAYMKANATKIMTLGGAFWDGGAQTFINKGTNGRWRDVLTPEDSRRYESIARGQLGDDCARWLATGRR